MKNGKEIPQTKTTLSRLKIGQSFNFVRFGLPDSKYIYLGQSNGLYFFRIFGDIFHQNTQEDLDVIF